jgi:hypothetical protein
VIWALIALQWWLKTLLYNDDYKLWDHQGSIMETIIASIVLDLILAGAEIFHKARLVLRGRNIAVEENTAANYAQAHHAQTTV